MNKTLQFPSLLDVLNGLKNDINISMNCVKIGIIDSFNQTIKSAVIQLVFKRTLPDDSIVSYPLLVDCPVFTLQGGGGAIQFPIVKGDTCIVLFSDRNIDNWFEDGSESAPFNQRCHDLSDGIALVGINSKNSDLPDYDTNINITIPTSKKLVVSGTTATAEILGNETLALFSEIRTLRNEMDTFITSVYNTHTHPVTSAPGTTEVPSATGSSPTAPVGTQKLKGA